MREIKFRAWDRLTNPPSMIFFNIYDCPLHPASCDVEIMQYTGLKDKNGVEIYEGDIMRHDQFWFINDCSVVEWSSRDAAYSFLGCPSEWGIYCEVIGNIYEDPELLEAS